MQILLTPDNTTCADDLYNRLTTELDADKTVLWFLTGGSNISVDIEVMARLSTEQTQNLTITLTDERYGEYGHADSNWQQLLDGGLDIKQARAFEVLQRDQQSLEQTTAIFASNLDVAIQEADVVIGFFGMGGDGHIAGILPHSPAVTATGLAAGYHSDAFTRITSTFEAIRSCNVALVFASGENKRQAIQNLQTTLSSSEQPAQVLKELPEAYVYNDQLGEK